MKPFKSIRKRRSRYVWLIVEIIVASAIAFYVLDPIVVSIYDSTRNFKYDSDRLVLVQLTRLDPLNPAFNEERATNSEAIESDIMEAIPRFAELNEVEKAIPLPARGFGSGEDSQDMMIMLPDSSFVDSFKATYIPHSDFFTTMGFKAASDIPGNPTIEEMNEMEVNFYREMICTRTMARIIYGDEYRAMEQSRKRLESVDPENSSIKNDMLQIVGIIEDTRAWGDRPWPLIRFYADPLSHSITYNTQNRYNILLRLKKGENAASFARRLNRDPELRAFGRVGTLEFKEAKAYSEFNGADSLLSPKERYRNILVIFFAINIFLGVFGTFWLLTRKRTEEAGIMRAFGATPRNVRLMLYAEGAIIALGASLIGCAIYVYYLSRNPENFQYGLSGFKDIDMTQLPPDLHTWVGDFWLHTGIVTAVVCLTMLLVVLAGIAIPAWRLSKINPVTALSDE